MKRYVFFLAYAEDRWDLLSAAERQEVFAAHDRFEAYVDRRGRMVSTAPLAATDEATTVRHRDGEVSVVDGPFAETVETIGGYYDAELPDLDAAIEAAALLPSQFAVEIRPTIVNEHPKPQ